MVHDPSISNVTEAAPNSNKVQPPTDAEQQMFFSGLKQILPDSAILTAVEQVKKSSSYPPCTEKATSSTHIPARCEVLADR